MVYAKTFISTVVLTFVYYFATLSGRHPLPLWPDALMIGSAMGGLTTLVAARFALDRKALGHFRNLKRLLWRGQ